MRDLKRNIVDLSPQPALTPDERSAINERVSLMSDISEHHINAMFLTDMGLSFKWPASYLDISNPDYRPPTADEVLEVVDRIKAMTGYSTNAIARLTGSPKNGQEGRKVAAWIRKGNIGYCEWRMLLIKAGLVHDFAFPIEVNGESNYKTMLTNRNKLDSQHIEE